MSILSSLAGLESFSIQKFIEQQQQQDRVEEQQKWLAETIKRELMKKEGVRREDELHVAKKLQNQLQGRVAKGEVSERIQQRIDLVNRYRDFLETPQASPAAHLKVPAEGAQVDRKAPADPSRVPPQERLPQQQPARTEERLQLFEKDVYDARKQADPNLLGATTKQAVARAESDQAPRFTRPDAEAKPTPRGESAGAGSEVEGRGTGKDKPAVAREKDATSTAGEKQASGEQAHEKPTLAQPTTDKFASATAREPAVETLKAARPDQAEPQAHSEQSAERASKQKQARDAFEVPALDKATVEKLAEKREKLSGWVNGTVELSAKEAQKLRAELKVLEGEVKKVGQQTDPKAVRKRDRLLKVRDEIQSSLVDVSAKISQREFRLRNATEKPGLKAEGSGSARATSLERELAQLEKQRTRLQKRLEENAGRIADVESSFLSAASAAQARPGSTAAAAASLGSGAVGRASAGAPSGPTFQATRNDSVSRVAREQLQKQGLLTGLSDDQQDQRIEKACDLLVRVNSSVLGAHPDRVMKGQVLQLPDFAAELGGQGALDLVAQGRLSNIKA